MVSLTYWMNRLQNIDNRHPLFVTMNPIHAPDPERVFQSLCYEHPIFDQAAVDAQGQLQIIQGVKRPWFCGRSCGFGFHEDALKSGIAVARALGTEIPWQSDVEAANQIQPGGASGSTADRADRPSLTAGD